MPYFKIFYNNGENTSQATEDVKNVYDPDTVFFGFVDSVPIALMSKRQHTLENIIKIIEIIKSEHHLSNLSIVQKLNTAQ